MSRTEFKVHKLNESGMEKARIIAANFESMLEGLEDICNVNSREMAIVRTKLEEACFFAKKAMASQPQNQEQ